MREMPCGVVPAGGGKRNTMKINQASNWYAVMLLLGGALLLFLVMWGLSAAGVVQLRSAPAMATEDRYAH